MGERDESVTEMQFDHSHITFGESITVTEAFERGELSTFYQRPSASQMNPAAPQVIAYADDAIATLPRPNLPSSSAENVPYVIYGASLEVHPRTPSQGNDESQADVDISSSEPSGQPLSSDELFDTTPDLSLSGISSQSDTDESNSPIIARRHNVSLASSSSSTTSEEIINEHANFMDHDAYQR